MIHLRPSTPEDVPFLRDLHHRAYRDVVSRQFGVWDEEAQNEWFETALAAAEFSVVECDGQRVGAVAVSVDVECLRLVELQILPEWQNRGLGSTVLEVQMEHARAGRRPIRLRVLRENRARALYERNGFVVIGQTDTHCLMEWMPR